jgi:hypothetical protein
MTDSMDSSELARVCTKAMDENKYVYVVHNGVGRDTYPYEIKNGRLYCYCSLHPDREVEGMYISNISNASVSDNTIGLNFPYPSDFA